VLNLYKYSLLPILLAQALRLRRSAIRLPEPPGPREGRAGEESERGVRVLFVGDSSGAGVGVTHQSNALALPTAQLLATRLQATVHWELIAKSGVNTAQALQMLKKSGIRRADLLVTALGTNDVTSQQSPRKFLAAYEELLEYAVTRLGVVGAVITGCLRCASCRWHRNRCAGTWVDTRSASIYYSNGGVARARICLFCRWTGLPSLTKWRWTVTIQETGSTDSGRG
jgi:hypothetical protein